MRETAQRYVEWFTVALQNSTDYLRVTQGKYKLFIFLDWNRKVSNRQNSLAKTKMDQQLISNRT